MEFKLQILLPPLKVNLGSLNFNKTEHAVFAETFLGEVDQGFQNRKVALNVLKIPLVLTESLSPSINPWTSFSSQGPRGAAFFISTDFLLISAFLTCFCQH